MIARIGRQLSLCKWNFKFAPHILLLAPSWIHKQTFDFLLKTHYFRHDVYFKNRCQRYYVRIVTVSQDKMTALMTSQAPPFFF